MQAMALEWWLRPVIMHERDGEQSAVVCMLLKRNPSAASASKLGVLIGLPKHPRCPNPVSSSTMKRTFGAPGLACGVAGQAGLETSKVRPITPGKAWPGSYSVSGIWVPP